MHFDALTLACVATEIEGVLLEGRVQQVLMVDEESVGLEIYADHTRHYLLLSASAAMPRAHLAGRKLRRGSERQPPLLLLLRKYVRGAILAAVRQPAASERLLSLRFSHPQNGETLLYAELIGRRANLILTDQDGRILDCLVRVGAKRATDRVLLPNHPYSGPRPQDKLPPLDDGTEEYYTRLAHLLAQPGKVRQNLVAGVAGMSPTLGREAAWRAGGDEDIAGGDVSLPAVVQALQSLWNPVQDGGWQPGLLMQGEMIAGFSAYTAHVVGSHVPQPSISACVERYYAAATDKAAAAADPYASLRGQAGAELRRAEKRLRRQLTALDADEPAPGEAADLRTKAEWLLALNSQIQPGQGVLEVALGDETLQIVLATDRSPVEQAQRMFKRAAKMERAADFIPRRRQTLNTDLAFLAELESDLSMAESQPAIEAVRDELRKMGLLTRRSRRAAPGNQKVSEPLRYETPTGFEVLVGRNARQNEVVTFRLAQPTDLWLHVRDAPGAHVVIRLRGAPADEETVQIAAQLAAHYSRLRGERAAGVAITEKRFVRRLAGGHTGQVTIRNERTITVPAQLPTGMN